LKVANIKKKKEKKKGFLNSIPNDLISYFQYKNFGFYFYKKKQVDDFPHAYI
jgi:hypothetical protein